MSGSVLGDFTRQAAAYGQTRPSYPGQLVEQLLQCAGVRAGDEVVDMGAGTGLFTQLLAGRGLNVYAVEPNAAMREQAPAMAEVQWVDGTFEATPLPDGQVRWIVAAQAFHWADPSRALPEMRRILRPGGAFTVLWNDRLMGRSPVLDWTQELIRRYVPTFDEGYRSQAPWGEVLSTTGHFGQVQYLEMEHVVPMSAERFVNLWRSHNRLDVAAGAGGVESMLGELAGHLRELGLKTVEVPLITRAWTAFAV